MHEHLAESEEEDVGEGKGNADTDVPSDSATTFLGRQGHTHYRQNECGERQSESCVLLDERELDIRVASHPLSVDQMIQFMVVQSLHSLFREVEILG